MPRRSCSSPSAAARVVGRISAHIDTLALDHAGRAGLRPRLRPVRACSTPRTRTIADALIATAEDWLREQGHDPRARPDQHVDLGRARPADRGLRSSADGDDGPCQARISRLDRGRRLSPRSSSCYTYELDITQEFPPIVQRIIQSGEKNPRIRIRKVDKSKFDEEAAIILAILNDAWSDNWGFVPLTAPEIDDVGMKLKPIVFNDLIRIAELDGKPVAFMITLPDLNEAIKPLNGNLLPFGWAKLLLVAAQAQGAHDARAADGRGQGAAIVAHGEPARLHDDRIYPPRRGRRNTARRAARSAGSSRTIRGCARSPRRSTARSTRCIKSMRKRFD